MSSELRTHQEIGLQQRLFFSDPASPGSTFWLSHGTRIYNKIRDLLREEYRKRGYQEVITPNIANVELWKQSGHYDKYRENMFLFDIKANADVPDSDAHHFGLKAMNCPLHCVIFKRFKRSYRDLPLRLADFGDLHRNEASGALVGLTRVRKFAQDDAHIFCRPQDLQSELQGVMDFMDWLYKLFHFEYELELSTRPNVYIGAEDRWNEAETILKQVLEKSGKLWGINMGDGAFYGPKIDVKIKDSQGRAHQLGTVQLDFNLPERFDLTYQDYDDSNKRPIMIHRAILGSFERFIAIVIEHLQGKWPLWLSPRQIAVVPISNKNVEYARTVVKALAGYHVDFDESDKHFKTKIRDAEQVCTNHILVVGDKEEANKSVNLRANNSQMLMTLEDYVRGQQVYHVNFY